MRQITVQIDAELYEDGIHMDSNRKEVLRAFEENKSYIKAKSD